MCKAVQIMTNSYVFQNSIYTVIQNAPNLFFKNYISSDINKIMYVTIDKNMHNYIDTDRSIDSKYKQRKKA